MRNKLNDLSNKEWLKFQKSWFIHNPPPRKKGVLVHPAKFPETMAQEFIEFFTKEGETVLDPMAGTGSTLVAALRAGRNSYGIELNPKYAQIAQNTISDERIQLGDSISSLQSQIMNGDAAQLTNYQLPVINYPQLIMSLRPLPTGTCCTPKVQILKRNAALLLTWMSIIRMTQMTWEISLIMRSFSKSW